MCSKISIINDDDDDKIIGDIENHMPFSRQKKNYSFFESIYMYISKILLPPLPDPCYCIMPSCGKRYRKNSFNTVYSDSDEN